MGYDPPVRAETLIDHIMIIVHFQRSDDQLHMLKLDAAVVDAEESYPLTTRIVSVHTYVASVNTVTVSLYSTGATNSSRRSTMLS